MDDNKFLPFGMYGPDLYFPHLSHTKELLRLKHASNAELGRGSQGILSWDLCIL